MFRVLTTAESWAIVLPVKCIYAPYPLYNCIIVLNGSSVDVDSLLHPFIVGILWLVLCFAMQYLVSFFNLTNVLLR